MATHNVVPGDQYMDLSRKLHDLDCQLLHKGGYPHSLDWLESFLQRAVDGRFFPDNDWRYRTVMREPDGLLERLARLELDDYDELALKLTEDGGMSLERHPALWWPYEVSMTVVPLQRTLDWEAIHGLIASRGLRPADLYETCAFLEHNRVIQQELPTLCLDTLTRNGKKYALCFTGDQCRRFVRVMDLSESDTFYPQVRVFACEKDAAPATR